MINVQPSPSFLEELASPRPDPGGGSAAAYSALVALALAEKVGRLELGRAHADDSGGSFWKQQLLAIHGLQEIFARLCHQDILVYAKVADALRHQTIGEQRRIAILEAIECPRQIMDSVITAMATALAIGEHCRLHLVADVMVAVELLGGALQGACHIAMANVPWLEGPSEQQELLEQLTRENRAGVEQLFRVRADLEIRLVERPSEARVR